MTRYQTYGFPSIDYPSLTDKIKMVLEDERKQGQSCVLTEHRLQTLNVARTVRRQEHLVSSQQLIDGEQAH